MQIISIMQRQSKLNNRNHRVNHFLVQTSERVIEISQRETDRASDVI